MKIIRPEQPQKQPEPKIIVIAPEPENAQKNKENPVISDIRIEKIEEIKANEFVDNNTQIKFPTIQDIMEEVIEDSAKSVTFEITLTKRQYELWKKKGELRWLKRELTGLNTKKKRK